ncbi:MAG: TonB-dependent receptor, partial [Gammaproteobacteria bacterium]
QEHLTAIRSPVYAGLGACGEFLYLEDGIPIRPAGFCNINNLFELNTEQARALEVWRGPASALLGGNALRGAINAETPAPERNAFSLEGGGWDYYRGTVELRTARAGHAFALAASATDNGGWRDDTGYDEQKLNLAHDTAVGSGAWTVRNTASLTRLNQQTGAFVSGYRAYEDRALSQTNASPNSYRDAWAARVASHWTHADWRITPYARKSRMTFLQHFIPGEPTEDNGQTSAGLQALRFWSGPDWRATVGAHGEWLSAYVEEYQARPLTTSSAFNNAVRPAGVHYDFEVTGTQWALFQDLSWSIAESLRLVQSARVERFEFDYDNRSLDGNTRGDGTRCGFGGCLYNRPADREDVYHDVSGRLGLEFDVSDSAMIYGVVSSGFRPPQVNELYRLQRGQNVAQLDTERIVAVEAGARLAGLELAVFADQARNVIFRDAAGLNVSDGRTTSKGIELSAFRALGRHALELSLTYAEHRYDFSGGATGGEFIDDGNMVDTAPRWLGNARWRYAPTARIDSELELILQGKHYINADNTATYGGHELLNWRLRYALSPQTSLFLRVHNLTDAEYAERADFAAFDPLRYRYFPGLPRHAFIGVSHAW